MHNNDKQICSNRIGIHYFPDHLHYREQDLKAWIPELKQLGISWIALDTPIDRAIPNYFIEGLLAEEIEPILHMRTGLNALPPLEDLTLLLETYSRWGIQYIVMFDKPNMRRMWPGASWVQTDLIECFLEIYLPYCYEMIKYGIHPVLPPLEPGGDYWDTAFLRSTLQALVDCKENIVLENLVLSAYANAKNLPIDWGAGGPERWPSTRPYYTPPEEQDQRGFRIFDWYNAISQAVVGKHLPIILLASGSRPEKKGSKEDAAIDPADHTKRNLAIVQLLSADKVESEVKTSEPIPENVLSCNFWLLATTPEDPAAEQAWYRASGTTLPIVDQLKTWVAQNPGIRSTMKKNKKSSLGSSNRNFTLKHYLLLPTYEWGIADWHLEVIQPYVKKYRPTIGFRIEEAALAAKVTLIGGEQSFPAEVIAQLEAAGCSVEQISGDGTQIATFLASV
jgi:hypothetical protein